jgi:hypothetical protein
MATQVQQPTVALKPSQQRNVIYSDELDYSIDELVHSDIQYTYAYPTNLQTLTLNNSGNAPVLTITIPPSVTHWSRNRYSYQLQIPPCTAAGNFIYVNANALTHMNEWDIIDQFTGAQWQGTQFGNFYGTLVAPGCTELTKFLTKSFYSTVPQLTPSTSQLYVMENISRYSVFTSPSQYVASQSTNVTTATTVAGSGTAIIDMFPQNPFTARRLYYIGASGAGVVLDFNIAFGSYFFTAGTTDKLVYNPSNLTSRMYFNACDNFCFNAGSATDPTLPTLNTAGLYSITAANNPASGVFANSGASIQNVYITLAAENNPQLAQRTIDLVTTGSGLYFPIGYPQIVQQNIGSSITTHQLSVPVTSQYGSSLLGIIAAPFSGNQTYPAFRNVHQRGYLQNYISLLAGKFIGNQTAYNCLLSQDYIYNKQYLVGSSVQTLGEYINSEWIHVESWVGTKPLHQWDSSVLSGKDLRTANTTYQINASMSPACPAFWNFLFIGQKMLHLSARGSEVLQ